MIKFLTNNKPKGLSRSFLNLISQAISLETNFKGKVEVNFVSRDEIKKINKEYREIDKETDILSFEIAKNEIVGQIFICYDIAVEQAKEYGWTTENEIALLLSHGVLHVYGYDHDTKIKAKEMLVKENKILKKLNLRPYETQP